MYLADNLDISEWVEHYTWHPDENLDLIKLFKNMIQVLVSIFWRCGEKKKNKKKYPKFKIYEMLIFFVEKVGLICHGIG